MRSCVLCKVPARVFCESDQAALCWDCDAKVHGANFLVARHLRTLLCHACQCPTPWTASGAKLGHTVSVCDPCVNGVQNRNGGGEQSGDNDDDDMPDDDDMDHDDDDDLVEDENDEGDSGGDEDEDGDSDGGDEDGDNQVVPWSSSTPPPPAASPSSSEESVSRLYFGGIDGMVSWKRTRMDSGSTDLRSQEAQSDSSRKNRKSGTVGVKTHPMNSEPTSVDSLRSASNRRVGSGRPG